MDGKRPDALSDAVLDRELDAALGVEPSPEFLARVRTRLASEPALVPRRFSGAVWHLPRPWLACATAAAILIAAALALWPPLARIDPEQASTGAAAPGTPRAAAPPTQRAATASRSPRPEVLRPQPASRRT